jgi:hypothetical protein
MSNLKNAILKLKKESGEVYTPDSLLPSKAKTVYEYAKQGGYTGTEKTFIDTFLNNSLEAHPKGSIYINSSQLSPAYLFGGAWEKIEDVFLFCAYDVSDNQEGYYVNNRGGEEKVQITWNTMA